MKSKKSCRLLSSLLINFFVLLTTFAFARDKHHKRETADNKGKLSILLLLNTNGGTQNTADGAVVLFDDNYSTAIGDEDSYKFSNLDENLAINRNGTSLSIEGRPAISSNDTVPLKITKYGKPSYYLKLEGSNFPPNLAAVVKDAFLQTETTVDLSATTLLQFYVDLSNASSAANRFSIVFYTRSVPVTVAAQPSGITVCTGGNTSFNVTATGFWLTYQWQVSTNGGTVFINLAEGVVYSGTSSNTLQVNGVSSSMQNYLYRAIVAGASPVSADTSDAALLTIANTWTGTNGTNWGNPANWACNVSPLTTDDVVITGSAPDMPVLTANTAVGSLNLQAGSSLSLNGQNFTVSGFIAGAGSLAGSISSNLTVNGSGIVSFANGSNLLNNLTVNSSGTVALGSSLSIAGILNIAAGTFALNDHVVTLRAGTEGGINFPNTKNYPATAMVAPVSGTIVYGTAGKFVAERYIPSATRAFRFISPSLSSSNSLRENWMENGNIVPGYGTHITGYGGAANGFDPTVTNNPSLFTYNNSTQAWENATSTSRTLQAGDAYRLLVRGDRTIDIFTASPPATATILRTTGKLQTGSVTYNAPFLNGVDGANRFNYVGNPYVSAVRFSSLTKTNIAPKYWVWDPNIGTRGAYVNYIYFTDDNGIFSSGFNNTAGASQVNDSIQASQAFFIQATGAAPALTFKETDKTFGTREVFRTTVEISSLSVKLLLDSNALSPKIADGVLALFNPAFSPFIGSEDAVKFANTDENFAIIRHDTALSIEGRPLVTGTDTIFLKLWQFRQKDYYLKIETGNFPFTVTASLKDAYLQTETQLDLATGTLLPFSVTGDSASFAPNRFMILFKQNGVLPVTISDLRAYQKGKGIQVDWTARSEENIERYEVEKSADGRQFSKVAAIQAKTNGAVAEMYNWYDKEPFTGSNYYRLKVVEKSGVSFYTKVVKVATVQVEGSVTIQPNPVTGQVIHLSFGNLDKGKYSVQLYNSSGQRAYTAEMIYDGISRDKSIKITPGISKGVYTLQISKGDKVITEKVIVQ